MAEQRLHTPVQAGDDCPHCGAEPGRPHRLNCAIAQPMLDEAEFDCDGQPEHTSDFDIWPAAHYEPGDLVKDGDDW
jgi:hypothetical protein